VRNTYSIPRVFGQIAALYWRLGHKNGEKSLFSIEPAGVAAKD
jgi:hypothetical protein